jgi:chromosome segregation ATPase
MAKKNSGNAAQNVTTVAQASAVKLNKATAGLDKVIAELQSTNESYDELVQNIELKQAELDTLDKQFEENVREMEADLKIRQKESEKALVQQVLNRNGEVSISADELQNLRSELASLQENFNKKVKSETEKAVAIVSNRHQSELKQQALEHKAETATMEARLETTTDKLSSLNTQIEDYKAQIKEDREARVEEARARGGQSITVQPEQKR